MFCRHVAAEEERSNDWMKLTKLIHFVVILKKTTKKTKLRDVGNEVVRKTPLPIMLWVRGSAAAQFRREDTLRRGSMEDRSPEQNTGVRAEESGSDNDEEQINTGESEEAVKTFKDLVGLFPQSR